MAERERNIDIWSVWASTMRDDFDRWSNDAMVDKRLAFVNRSFFLARRIDSDSFA